MPEGPTIVILREQATKFVGRRVEHVDGNTTIGRERLCGECIVALRSWGKHFLIDFGGFALRVHFMLFGSYRIDERRENASPRLSLGFDNGELNFYACSLKFIEGDLDAIYDWTADVMSDAWDPAAARRKLRARPDTLACDALLDQTIFSGVGNIIKNEVLFRIRVHPLSRVGMLPVRKLVELVREARNYSFEFLEWKRAFVLKRHWLVHNRSVCSRCDIALRRAYLGRTHFFCTSCQIAYGEVPATLPTTSRRPRPRRTTR